MEEITYCKIEFINCNMGYDYTICPWHEIQDQISSAEYIFDGYDEKNDNKPEIKMSPVFMTEKEFGEWLESCIEP